MVQNIGKTGNKSNPPTSNKMWNPQSKPLYPREQKMRHTKLPRLHSQRLNSTRFATHVSVKIFLRRVVSCDVCDGGG